MLLTVKNLEYNINLIKQQIETLSDKEDKFKEFNDIISLINSMGDIDFQLQNEVLRNFYTFTVKIGFGFKYEPLLKENIDSFRGELNEFLFEKEIATFKEIDYYLTVFYDFLKRNLEKEEYYAILSNEKHNFHITCLTALKEYFNYLHDCMLDEEVIEMKQTRVVDEYRGVLKDLFYNYFM